MKKTIALALALLLLTALCVSCRETQSKIGKEVRRVISLSPNITEILYALGQQDKIVAVSDFCTYPPQARKKEKIGGLLNPNLEKIVYLRPDLIIGTPAHNELAAGLKSYNIPSLLLANDDLADIFSAIDTLGAVLNCRKQADSLTSLIRDSLNYYRQATALHPGALLVIGRQAPQLKDITVAAGHTFLSEVWTLMGGKNIFAELPARYAQINAEAIQQKNPDCIIEFKFKAHWNAQKQKELLRQWQSLEYLRAARRGRVFVLSGDYTLIPGPRIYLLARDYSQILRRLNKKFD